MYIRKSASVFRFAHRAQFAILADFLYNQIRKRSIIGASLPRVILIGEADCPGAHGAPFFLLWAGIRVIGWPLRMEMEESVSPALPEENRSLYQEYIRRLQQIEMDLRRLEAWEQTPLPLARAAELLDSAARQLGSLEEQQQMFEHFFYAAPDASLVVDARGKIRHANRQVEYTFGYPRGELIGRRIETLIPDRYHRRHASLRGHYSREPIARPMGIGLELYGRRKDGSEFPVDVNLSPVLLGGETQVICVVRDLSRRAEAEEAARRQESYVKLLQDVAIASNQSDSINTVLQITLDRICAVLGWPVGHAILASVDGASLRSTRLWHLPDTQSLRPFREVSEQLDFIAMGGLPSRIVRTGKAESFSDIHRVPEFRRAQEARQAGLLASFGFPILAGSQTAGVLEFFDTRYTELDEVVLELMTNIGIQIGRVFERQHAREALLRSEARFRTVFDKSAIGIQLTNADGYVEDTNPALQHILGFSAAELRSLSLEQLIYPADMEKTYALLRSLLRGEQDGYQSETRYVHKDGSTIWAQTIVSAVTDRENNVRLVVTLVQDISALKRKSEELDEVQRKLLESAEMERISLARELHDGPLQDLYGASFSLQDFLSENIAAHSNPELQKSHQTIHNVIVTLRAICGDLRPPTLGPFGLEKAIRSHVERVELMHPQLRIHLELMSDRQMFNERARLALFRIYQQLLSNVTRHSQAENVWIRLALDESDVTLEVEDDGRGFALPPRWVDLAREGHAGLLGVLERVEAFGGSMQVQPDRPRGALVRVRVPLARINRLEQE